MRLTWNRLAVFVVALIAVAPVLAQPGGPGGPGGGRFQLDLSSLLQNKSVQEELKLTEEQTAKVKDLVDGIRKKVQEATSKIAAETIKGGNVLTAAQVKRLMQIEVQQLGVNALARESIQKELGLSDGQVTKIKGEMEGMTKSLADLRKDVGKDFKNFKKMQEEGAKIRTATEEKLSEILTDTQKTKFLEMIGEKFELKMGRPGFGGGN